MDKPEQKSKIVFTQRSKGAKQLQLNYLFSLLMPLVGRPNGGISKIINVQCSMFNVQLHSTTFNLSTIAVGRETRRRHF
jgi:hypothetical protein